MPTASVKTPAMRAASKKHAQNIHKRGNVPKSRRSDDGYTVGPYLLGFLCFVVFGSVIFQILQSIQFGAPPRA
eukprot:m.4645 g.4645  ORF g.4645 m.4645 type:complete len:73 (-) comp7087_c0_seq1:153-371(-)